MSDAIDLGTVTPGETTNLLSLIPGPVGAFIAVLLLLMPIVSEVKGWTNGPLAKRVSKAAEKAEAERVERDDKWQARDRRVEELEAAMRTMRGRMDEQKTHMGQQQEQINELHRLSDAQNRLLANHTDWDRRAQSEVNRLGGNLPAPPPLYVYDTEETP